MDTQPLPIFISSRLDECAAERDIAREVANQLGFAAQLWEDFPPQFRPERETYETHIDTCFLFVLIVWNDLSPVVERELKRAKREQKPILAFVKDAPGIEGHKPRDPRLQQLIDQDLRGLTYTTFHTITEFRDRLRKALTDHLIWSVQKPVTFPSRRVLYAVGADLATRAKRRICLVARTPILLLGARPYGSPTPLDFEKQHYDSLREAVNRAAQGEVDFFCAYLAVATRQEIEHQSLHQLATANLTELFHLTVQEKQGSHFILASYPSPEETIAQFTFMVGDDHVAIWFKDPATPDEDVSISFRDKRVADALCRLAENVSKKNNLQGLLQDIGLTPATAP